jgi:hypothetical protein
LVSAVYANQQVLNAVEVTTDAGDSFVTVRVASIVKSSDAMWWIPSPFPVHPSDV